MNNHQAQENERSAILQSILESTSRKKVIVAGPGTGKTFTFSKLFEQKSGGSNIAMTFIRKLVWDMEQKLGVHATVMTFHAYCKKVLHEKTGHFELVPYLTKIVERDAGLLGLELDDFDSKFRQLKENSDEVAFYLKRGDYYGVVSFNDSVYRLYQMAKSEPDTLPEFNQIVVDEFQDFNILEVAFIAELAKHGSILVVGDDDQAIYGGRDASPKYLRNIHGRPDFEKFVLPFCSRCPLPIVQAVNGFITKAADLGFLDGRIQKRYECYLADKQADSEKYPKVITATCTTVGVVGKYVANEIEKILPEDIAESKQPGEEYPTVLIIGPKQYLKQIAKQLKEQYPQLTYNPSEEQMYDAVEGYKLLMGDINSNLGWRILAQFFLTEDEEKEVISETESSKSMRDILSASFIAHHEKVVSLLKELLGAENPDQQELDELKRLTGNYAKDILGAFVLKTEEEEAEELVPEQPTILLTSYEGSKGLSAGHVFIVGANNGDIPRNPREIHDTEICKFVVALTRTRKQCHVISNSWLIAPRDRRGKVPAKQKSAFFSWLPTSEVEDRGYLKASELKP